MMFDKTYLENLCKKYGLKPKFLRDNLWPEEKTRGLSYFNKGKTATIKNLEMIADIIGCSTDEILRRVPIGSQIISGDNNQVGNVTVQNDVEHMRMTIVHQNELIKNMKDEIKRMQRMYEQQLKAKDNQINSLIEFSKTTENQ